MVDGSGVNYNKDIDYDHSHGGLGAPHVHDWGRPKDPNDEVTHKDRGEGRKPLEGEIPNENQ